MSTIDITAHNVPTYKAITQCRACGSQQLTPIVSFGLYPISDFLDPEIPHREAPLNLVMCENCTLTQLKDTATQELLYTRHYWYKSGISSEMRSHLGELARTIQANIPFKAHDIFLDIGSNDGTFLRSITSPCIKVGVDPATNLREEGKQGLNTHICDFWNFEAYNREVKKPAKVITAFGMLYDLDDPNTFIADVSKALDPEGVFIAQLMTLRDMLFANDMGNICHEHLEFYTIRSLSLLLRKYGMEIYDIERNSVNGASTRFYICKHGYMPRTKRAVDEIKNEPLNGVYSTEHIWKVFDTWKRNRDRVEDLIRNLVDGGMSVIGYGASTKGNTLIKFFGLNRLIREIADANPEKHGKFPAGTAIKIISKEEFRQKNPDYALVLPYAFIEEFKHEERDWYSKGGRFIVPLPIVHMV